MLSRTKSWIKTLANKKYPKPFHGYFKISYIRIHIVETIKKIKIKLWYTNINIYYIYDTAGSKSQY